MHSLNDPNDVRVLAPRRHEIDEANRAAPCFDFRFENQRPVAVTPARAGDLLRRREHPSPVFRIAEERGETRARIEARKTKPIQRPVAPYQRSRLGVTEE